MPTDTIFSLLIPACILLHLAFAPYTKVEESFNIQATHDILTYGISTKNSSQFLGQEYDHVTFTGPVPRTFVGPLALAGASWPFIWLSRILNLDVNRQVIVRAILGLFNAYALIAFRNRVAKAFGRNAANWYAIFQASQFHLMYYASRTLPNFFAFGLTTFAARNLLPLAGRRPSSRSSRRRQCSALVTLTITTVVFRSELAILIGSHVIYLFFHPYIRLPVTSIIKSGILGLFIGLLLTLSVDTFFWRSPTVLWPELAAFKFNVLHSKSSYWGTSPWHFYFTSSLPRLLFNPFILFLIPFTFSIPILRQSVQDILAPNLLFVIIYSLQPHKEWRFIVYIIPPCLAVASAGASWIWTRRAKTLIYRGLALIMIASTIAAYIASAGMCAISSLNYPGAEALERLHEIGASSGEKGVKRVHLDQLACMTGVTRFLQQSPRSPPPILGQEVEGQIFWTYDKTEDQPSLIDKYFWADMDYALAEWPETVLGEWEIVDVVNGFVGFTVVKPGEVGFAPPHAERGAKVRLDDIGRRWKAGESIFTLSSSVTLDLYSEAEIFLRSRVTRGWWIEPRMEPKIRIMKRIDPPLHSGGSSADDESNVLEEDELENGIH